MIFNVVFEGGGAKGVAFAGALDVLQEDGHKIAQVVGTSAGAVTATLLTLGLSPADMLKAVTEKLEGAPRFSSFLERPAADDFSSEDLKNSLMANVFERVDLPGVSSTWEEVLDQLLFAAMLANPDYRGIFSLIERGSFCKDTAFINWISELLTTSLAKNFDHQVENPETITLKSLYELTGRHLSLIASDISHKEMLVLNHQTAPNLPVIWAVRMSMSIPLVWPEVIWRDTWGTYTLGGGEPRAIAGNAIVDGGILSNFPLRLFINGNGSQYGIVTKPTEQVLGLLIDEKLPIPGLLIETKVATGFAGLGNLKMATSVVQLFDTMSGYSDIQVLREHEELVCRLPSDGIGTLEFGIEGEKLNAFLSAARAAVRAHLDERLR